jgi:acetyl-CoA decarbonylase/synthase complex subunit gamma
MALTGLQIFKLLPKTNCKKCGMPTCLAFAMQLAQKKASLEACPFVSEEAKEQLAAAAQPPMRLVKFGPDGRFRVGGETVMFRHEEKFHNPTVLAVTIPDTLSGDGLKKRIESIKSLQFERIGTKIRIGAAAVVNESGSADSFAAAAAAVAGSGDLALILLAGSPEAASAACAKAADAAPLVGTANAENAEAMAGIASEHKCPLVAGAASCEELADLAERVRAAGVEDIVLCPDSGDLGGHLRQLTRIRAAALKKTFRPLGYPVLSDVGRFGKDPGKQAAAAAALVCKYSNIVVIDVEKPQAVLPLLTAVMNVFSDPQKPVQVEPKVYTIGEPDENSPLMFTTNFSLTYYTVEADVEASRIASYVLVVDTEGTSVLTAYSGDKLNEKTVADAMARAGAEQLVKHRKLIIPGYVAVMSGKLEEATNWQVMVGPRESAMIPKYLQEVWKQT